MSLLKPKQGHQGLLAGLSPANRYAPRHGSTLPLALMLADLKTLTPDQWGLYAFDRDPVNGRLGEEQRLDLIHRAQQCGREEAAAMLAAQPDAQPTLIAKRMGLRIERPDVPNGGGNVIFAQFEEPDCITLFMDTAQKAEDLLSERPELAAILGKRSIEQVLTAHELFHAVEMRAKKTIFTQTERITLWKLGPLKYSSGVSCLAEIAGMEFAAALLKMEFSPYVYDVFFVSLYDKAVASDLYRGICRLTGHVSIEQTADRQAMMDAFYREENPAENAREEN